jgi:PST family polysaccharide transporter
MGLIGVEQETRVLKRRQVFQTSRSSGFGPIIRNTGWLVADRIFRAGGNFLLVTWIARHFGAEDFGRFNYALAFAALFSGVSTLGLDAILVRELLRSAGSRDALLGTAAILRFSGGVICWGAMVAIAVFVPTAPVDLIAIAGAMLLFQSLDVIDAWFQSSVRAKYPVYARNFAFVVAAFLRVALILGDGSLASLVATVTFEAALAAFLLILIYRYDGRSPSTWQWDTRLARELLRDAAPLLVSGLAILVYMRIDQIMLASFAGYHEVGIFSAAVRLTELWYFIPVALMASIFPAIVRARAADSKRYNERLILLFGVMGWSGIALGALTAWLAEPLVLHVYGVQYASAAPVLSVQAWMAAFVFFGVARSRWLLAENRQRDAMVVDIIGLLLNVAANAALIPRFGALGAAVASLTAALGANALTAIFSMAIRDSLRMYAAGLLYPALALRRRWTKDGSRLPNKEL